MPASAAVRPDSQPITVQHYRLLIDLDERQGTYEGSVEIQFTPTRDLKQVWFHAEGLEILEAEFGEVTIPHTIQKDRVVLKLPEKIPAGEHRSIGIAFRGAANARAQEGLFVIQRPHGLPGYFTQLEAQHARKLFPCYDEPFAKATTEVFLTSHPRYTLLSNGNPVAESVARGADGRPRKTVHFQNPDPISTYLITLVAAELEPVTESYRTSDGRQIPLTIYVAPGRGAEVRYAMHVLREALAIYENYFGRPYPWARYGIVAVEGLTWGGMENKGLTNLNAEYLYWSPNLPYAKQTSITSLVAHELAHEWFGNLVTMQWWQDLWLNEAFATFMEQLATAEIHGADFGRYENFRWLQRAYFPQDQGPLAHAIVVRRAQTVDELFDGVTYAKGVQVVRMLERLVGETNFQRAIQAYMRQYAGGNASTEEFLATIEAETGVALRDFAQAWLHQAGFPQLRVTHTWDAERQQLTLRVQQGARAYRGVLPVGIYGPGLAQVMDLQLAAREEIFHFDLPAAPQVISVNADGSFLAQHEGAEDARPVLDSAAPVMARVQALHRLLQVTDDAAALQAVVTTALQDPSPVVRLAVLESILEAPHELAWQRAVARGAEGALIANLAETPRDPLRAALQHQCLTLLGSADNPDVYPLLHARLGHEVADIRLGSIAGLLRSQDPERFTRFHDLIRSPDRSTALVMDLLIALAETPDPQAVARVNQYLQDPRIVPHDDSSTPIRALRALHRNQIAVIFSPEGVAAVTEAVRTNRDRPSVAAAALRVLEGVAQATPDGRARVADAMQSILQDDPPVMIQSLGERIFKAAR